MEDSGDKRKFLSRGLTPNIITNKMSEMHNKVLEFVIGFESAQKSNDLLLSHWEDAVEDFDSYSRTLRALKKLFTCRITKLHSTLRR
ncbi:unnamed protein product [Lepeophtheirus salmonis]|uniref:(salmon louse) hypothetical protein n=1 Tax=Lepeophtheirus salmonis TaxID=72036 RepID=A0A7R8HDH8_LEPSM|nr:unnamed protein product [Lepeophtheirus salmonis]CAF3026645.1 unnamed protein product [Lepeophtheirus salmonis]